MKTTPACALYDFFGSQDVLRLFPDNLEAVYVPDAYGARLHVYRERRSVGQIVVSLAHELGHFVTVPENRLGLIDYGFANSTEEWPARHWEAELDAVAHQLVILRTQRRHRAATGYISTLALFVRQRGRAWIATQPGLGEAMQACEPGRDCQPIVRVLHDVLEKRIVAAGSYTSLLDEFHRRIALLAARPILAGEFASAA